MRAERLRYQRAMRITLALVTLGVLFWVGAGCAASSQSVEAGRSARYRGDKLALFAAVKGAVESKYQLAESDETTLRMETAGRWYTPEGLGASERNNDMRDVPNRSVHLKMVVKLVPDGELWVVSVDPVMLRYFAGRPNPDKLAPDDPSVPGWAIGRIEQMHAAIYEALKQYSVPAGPAAGAK